MPKAFLSTCEWTFSQESEAEEGGRGMYRDQTEICNTSGRCGEVGETIVY